MKVATYYNGARFGDFPSFFNIIPKIDNVKDELLKDMYMTDAKNIYQKIASNKMIEISNTLDESFFLI